MTPLFPAQRAAEEFDRVLSGTATPAVADRYADLLGTVAVMRARPEVLPRAEFSADLRARVMTAAATELGAAPSVIRFPAPPRPNRNRRRLGTVAASLVIVGGSAGMAAAASGALPGEALYPIKRGVEQINTAVHLSDAGKGGVLLDQAATRLDEVRQLESRGSPDSALVTTTLDSFRRAADDGAAKLFASYQSNADPQAIVTVRSFTQEQMHGVAALSGSSAGTDALLVDSADTLADIDQQARVLCGACTPDPALTPPPALSAGAGALAVDTLLARPTSQAQVDIAQARAARVSRLLLEAERQAGKLPALPAAGPGAASGLPSAPTGGPLTSTITPNGQLIPTVTTGAAVTELVSGVTGSVSGGAGKITSQVGKVVGRVSGTDPTSPLRNDLKKLGDTGASDAPLPSH